MLSDQGFRRVLLLLGYLPDPVVGYFGDGSKWGLSIEYSVTSPDNETGQRLKLAADQLDPTFLLAYCDNYWPMQLEFLFFFPCNELNQAHAARISLSVSSFGTLGIYLV